MQPHRIFLWIALVGGIILVFLTPPFQVPDEFGHFYRAYQISEGGLLGTRDHQRIGGYLPSSLRKIALPFTDLPFHPERRANSMVIVSACEISLNAHDRTFIDFCAQGIMLPLAYIPQAAGIGLLRPWNPPALALLYTGRLFNLLAWVLLTALAIRLIPRGKWVLATLALAPMCLFEAASLSYDAFANGSAFLLLAYVLKHAQDARRLSTRDFVLLGLLVLAPMLTKPFFFPFLFLPLLIANRNGQWRDKRWLIFGGICGVVAIAAWSYATRNFIPFEEYNPAHRAGEAHPLYPGVDPARQFFYIIQHPLAFIRQVTTIYFDLNTWREWIGSLGWVDTPLPQWFYVLFSLLLVFMLWWDRPVSAIWNLAFRSLLCLVALFAGMAIVMILYMQNSPAGAPYVIGFQGRYLVAIVPLVLFSCQGNRAFPDGLRRLKYMGPAILLFLPLLTIGTVYLRYYHQ